MGKGLWVLGTLGGIGLVLIYFCGRLQRAELHRKLVISRYVECANITHPIINLETDRAACVQAIDAIARGVGWSVTQPNAK